MGREILVRLQDSERQKMAGLQKMGKRMMEEMLQFKVTFYTAIPEIGIIGGTYDRDQLDYLLNEALTDETSWIKLGHVDDDNGQMVLVSQILGLQWEIL